MLAGEIAVQYRARAPPRGRRRSDARFQSRDLREAAEAPQRRRQVLAIDELHRQKQLSFRFADVVDATDVGMRHLPRRADLRVELRQTLRITAQPRRQELQRDGLAQPEIVGAIDLTHPAAPEQPDDAVRSSRTTPGVKRP